MNDSEIGELAIIAFEYASSGTEILLIRFEPI